MSRFITLFTTLLLIANAASEEQSPPSPVLEPTPAPVSDDALRQRLEELDQEVRVLKRKAELAEEAAKEKSKTAVSSTAGDSGFGFVNADKSFTLRFGALIQTDARFRLDDDRPTSTDTAWTSVGGNWGPYVNTFTLAKVRPQLSGTVAKWIDYRVLTELAGTVGVQDAYIDANFSPRFRILIGKAKVAFGLERGQSDTSVLFPERGLTDRLSPNRDVGIAFHGELTPAFVWWIGLYNGALDGGSRDTDYNDDKAVAARIWTAPFMSADSDWINGLWLGIGCTSGYENAAGGLSTYRTSLSNTPFFTYTAAGGTTAYGRQTRFSPQFYWSLPHVSLLADQVTSQQTVARGGRIDDVTVTAWQVAGSWVLTGERPSYAGVKPKLPFAPGNGQWGALELVARFGQLAFSDEAFDTTGATAFARRDQSASAAQAIGAGINWHLTQALKWQFAYERTSFTDGAGTLAAPVDHEAETFLHTRVSFTF